MLLHTTTRKMKVWVPRCGEKNLQFHFSAASDETCMPDLCYRAGDAHSASSSSSSSSSHPTVTFIRFALVPDLQYFFLLLPPFFVASVLICFFFGNYFKIFPFKKVFVSTLNHDLAWNIAQQLFTELQKTNDLDWSTHNIIIIIIISHRPVLKFLVVLFKKEKVKPPTKCKHEGKNIYRVWMLIVPPPSTCCTTTFWVFSSNSGTHRSAPSV